ncbi:MAG: hypothetical protein WC343_03220 [Bacilli bacterium]
MQTDVVECPVCWGRGQTCVSTEHDPDACPQISDGCEGCEDARECSFCLGTGYVTEGRADRHRVKMASLKWGEA